MPIKKSKAAAAPEEQQEMFTYKEMGLKPRAKNQGKRTITSAMSGPELVEFIYEEGNPYPVGGSIISYGVSASTSASPTGGLQ